MQGEGPSGQGEGQGGREGAPGGAHPPPPPPPQEGLLQVDAVIDLDDGLHLRLLRWQGSVHSGWGAGAVRRVLPCPHAPGWVVLLQHDTLWLLRLSEGGEREGGCKG